MSAEPTLATQLREMIVPPACVELIEQAAARLDEQDDAIKHYHAETMGLQLNLDELERQLAKVQYWRDRHCRESEQHAQRSGDNWKAWKAAERQLAAVAQAERSLKDANKFVSEWLWTSTDRRTSGMAWLDEYKADAAKMCLTFALGPCAAKEPEAEQFDPESEDQIEAILIEKSELSRLRAVAEAAKTFIHSEGRENIVAAELALVNAIEQSYS